MLEPQFTTVLGSRSREQFRDEVVRFANALGFDTVSATVVLDRPTDGPEFITVDNTPSRYRHIFDDPANFSRCPVLQHCKVSGAPIVWDQSTYTCRNKGAVWERQAEFGYRFGIGLALHLPRGRHFFLGVDRDQALPSCSAEVTRIVSALTLFAVHANEAAAVVVAPILAEVDVPSLTPREREVLRWTLEGKTAWEVGMILSISARTAAIHANNASHKLGCVSKHQAALHALQRGLI